MMTEIQDKKQLIRLDKWLWVARFYKTRAIAREMIQNGKVYYDDSRVKPNKLVTVGAIIRLKQGWDEKTIVVQAIALQRLSGQQALMLYQETEQSRLQREKFAKLRKDNAFFITTTPSKPDKKQRRKLNEVKIQRQNGELN